MTTQTEKEMSAVFEKYGIFWAFNQKQYDESAKEGVTYVRMPAGELCPKEHAKAYVEEACEIINNGVKRQVEEQGAEAIIRDEFFNHECQITMDISSMKEAIATHIELFPELFTDEVIIKVADQCFKEAVEKDWF